mmetsp:Transcript_40603/g.95438  ORF Transcript_40603/g.95438 Transcript_40603/m.95438 type:complete len:515 (-) Transcript_40603:11-1555(-)
MCDGTYDNILALTGQGTLPKNCQTMWCMCCHTNDNSESIEPLETKLSRGPSVLKASLACALWDASAGGNANEVQNLIFAGVDVNAADAEATPRSRGSTALIRAARAGHVSVVNTLLGAPGIDVSLTTENDTHRSKSRFSALHWASREGHGEVVRQLMTHPNVDPNQRTELGYTALMVAAQAGSASACRALLRDPRTDMTCVWKSPSGLDFDALKLALVEGHDEVAKALVSINRADSPNLNALTRIQSCSATPLAAAVILGHAKMVKAFLDARADPSIPDSKGRSPLEVALEADSTEIAMLLVSAGAKGGSLFTPFRLAQIQGSAQVLQGMCKGGFPEGNELIPAVHKAVLNNSMQELSKAMAELSSSEVAALTLDGGGLPPVYWAIELAQWTQVQALLTSSHGLTSGFVDRLLRGKYGAISTLPSAVAGERVFQVIRSLLADNAGIIADKEKSQGACAIIRPFCASVPALRYFQQNEADFDWLRDACAQQCLQLCSRVDKDVGRERLLWLSKGA